MAQNIVVRSDINENTGRGGYINGMNTRDDARELKPGQCSQLVNAFPGSPPRVREGMSEVVSSGSDPSGFYVDYTPESIHVVDPTGDEWIFSFVRTQVSPYKQFAIEVWNITDDNRTSLSVLTFDTSDVHFNFLKLNDWIYCFFDEATVTNATNAYQTDNLVIYWDTDNLVWAIRSMGLQAPEVQQAQIIGSAEDEPPFDPNAYGQAKVFNGQLIVTNSTNSISANSPMGTWETRNVLDWRYLTANTFTNPNGYNGGAVVYNNRLWHFGGKFHGISNAVHNTTDGKTWTTIGSAGWTAREGFASFVYAGKMWAIGGLGLSSRYNDVWSSTDGVTWTEVLSDNATPPATQFSQREGMAYVVYDNKMWIIGGNDGSLQQDVWSSTDGITWTEETASGGFSGRAYHKCAVFKNKMFVVGYTNTVYSSTDGITWTQETSDCGFTYYTGSLIVFNNVLYWFFGRTGPAFTNDIYYTTDGITWTLLKSGLNVDKYYSLAWTFVRRTDPAVILSDYADYFWQNWDTVNGVTIVGTDETRLSGLVTLATNGALTGTGSLFNSELVVGDRIRIDGMSEAFEITNITNDTSATIDNTNLFVFAAGSLFAKLPSIGDYMSTQSFVTGELEGMEDIEQRQTILMSSADDYGRLLLTMPDDTEAINRGATHLRYRRTLEGDTATIAEGLSHRFVIDIALQGTDNFFIDNIKDTTLSGDTNFLVTTGKDQSPNGRFPVFTNGRLWLHTESGIWQYSDIPGNTQFPEKFASIFELDEQFKSCDPSDGMKDTGSAVLMGDLYLFKERKIFVVKNSDVSNNPVRLPGNIGCICPNTITPAEHPKFGSLIFFLSESGPAALRPGGKIELLLNFPIAELWPGGEVMVDSSGVKTTDSFRESVTGGYHRDTWYVLYNNTTETFRQFGYHVSVLDDAIGGFQITYPNTGATSPFIPRAFVSVDYNKAYLVSDIDNYKVAWFLKPKTYIDSFNGAFQYSLEVKSRPFYIDKSFKIMAELWDAYIDVDLQIVAGSSYTHSEMYVKFYSDFERFLTSTTYSEIVETSLSTLSYNSIRRKLRALITEGFYGRWFEVYLRKIINPDESFVFHGFELGLAPQYNLDSEFKFNAGDRQNGWS